jgi:hypothetical protein
MLVIKKLKNPGSNQINPLPVILSRTMRSVLVICPESR